MYEIRLLGYECDKLQEYCGVLCVIYLFVFYCPVDLAFY